MIDRISATASIAVRHAGAYADLIASDLSLSSRDLRRQLVAGATLGLGILLAVALACVLAIAAAWDTPARLWVIGGGGAAGGRRGLRALAPGKGGCGTAPRADGARMG